jgi:putative transposase
MRWRLLIEEFGPRIEYIKGPKNIVADALSRLDLMTSAPTNSRVETSEPKSTELLLAECYGLEKDDLPSTAFPVSYPLIQREQEKDETLLRLAESSKHYSLKDFHGGGRTNRLLCYKDRIVIPKRLQSRVVHWYHYTLCHPGINRTEETISQHFYWKNMRDQITRDVSTCGVCQKQKKQRKKYGLLPEKKAEFQPWERLCVDLIGPYKIKKNKKGRGRTLPELKCVTMIDPATGWFEIRQYDDKRSITVANIVEQEWLTRYPRPSLITLDRGSEFIGEDFRDMCENDYGIKRKVISTRNPQANAIVERAHQTLGNLIRSFELQDNPYLDPDDPWGGILAAASFAMRATYHTTLQATPGQLVFGRDMILNTQYLADWTAIKARKQELIRKNNIIENSRRIPHEYRPGDQVMLEHHRANKYEQPYKGPYIITRVNENGTVRLKMGAVTDTVNIRRIHPFKTTSGPQSSRR